MTPFFETASLSLRYGSKQALRDVSLAVPRFAITALVGPSGCGKTSLLACLNRLSDLVPGAAVGGRVLCDGADIHAPGVDVVALRRRVGMIFQKPSPFPLSIRKNLDMPLKNHGVSDRGERAALAEKALRDVGLWSEVKDRLDGSALELSGGQQQRLCIARTLALSPEAVLFDEPCSALDPIASGVVEDLIASLRGRYTVVIVTHNLAQARRIADEVALLWSDERGGRLVEQGPVTQVFDEPRDELTRAFVTGRRG